MCVGGCSHKADDFVICFFYYYFQISLIPTEVRPELWGEGGGYPRSRTVDCLKNVPSLASFLNHM